MRPWGLERAAETGREPWPGLGGRVQELGWALGRMDRWLPWRDRPQGPEPAPGPLLLWKVSVTHGKGTGVVTCAVSWHLPILTAVHRAKRRSWGWQSGPTAAWTPSTPRNLSPV